MTISQWNFVRFTIWAINLFNFHCSTDCCSQNLLIREAGLLKSFGFSKFYYMSTPLSKLHNLDITQTCPDRQTAISQQKQPRILVCILVEMLVFPD